jgi:hypothetical protein
MAANFLILHWEVYSEPLEVNDNEENKHCREKVRQVLARTGDKMPLSMPSPCPSVWP